jgi:HAAS domain-containing protein
MTTPDHAKQEIEAYLAKLRAELRGFNDQQVAEIVAELRSHILDKLAIAGDAATPVQVDAILAALGTPEELANQYITDNLLARAEVSRSPLRILDSLFRWASLSVAGFFVLISSVLGYFFGAVFILVAILKPFHPQTAGLWLLRDSTGDPEFSFRMGFGSTPLDGRDLLGWWIVPLGILAGCALVTLTTRSALWCARQYRKSRALPPT